MAAHNKLKKTTEYDIISDLRCVNINYFDLSFVNIDRKQS